MCNIRSAKHGLFCGLCYSNVKGRSNHAGHYRFKRRKDPLGGLCMALAKPSAAAPSAGANGAVADSEFVVLYPQLAEYVTGTRWDDGTDRESSSLLIFAEAGLWKCCLNDRALGRKLWATGTTLEGALAVLDSVLVSSGADWRPDKQPARSRR